jgi:hypothetical protein
MWHICTLRPLAQKEVIFEIPKVINIFMGDIK